MRAIVFRRALWALAVMPWFLTACGGGGGSGGSDSGSGNNNPPTVQPPTSDGAVARVEIVQAGAMLQPGGNTTLTARVLDANGNTLSSPITWRSSRTAVTVDSAGVATAGQNVDSALLTATAGGISSAPVMVIVAQPAPGARIVTDADVAADPQPLDGAQTGRIGSRFRAALTGDAPSIGQVLLAAGVKGVSGRVVSVAPTASGQQEVVFEVVGLGELPGATTASQRELRNLRDTDQRGDVSLAMDASGAAYLSAKFQEVTNYTRMTLYKFAADGTPVWSTAINDTWFLKPGGVVLGANDIVYAYGDGYTEDANSVTTFGAFVYRLDGTSGTVQDGTHYADFGNSVTTDQSQLLRSARLFSVDANGGLGVLGVYRGVLDGVGSGVKRSDGLDNQPNEGLALYVRRFAFGN